MSIDTLPNTEGLEARTERLASEGKVQELIDGAAYDGYDDANERMRFLPVDTYHEGVVYLGGDADAQTVPLNNGQLIFVPRDEGANATVLRVETNKTRLGRPRPVLASYHIEGVMGPDPEVTVDEKQPVTLGTGLQLDTEDFGFIKTMRHGDAVAHHSRAAQQLMESGALGVEQKLEFGLVGASLRALEATGLFTR